MILFWILYLIVSIGAFVVLTGTTVEDHKREHHIPQPKTGILIILKSLFWPLALLIAGISWAFQSGVPKPDPKFENYDPPQVGGVTLEVKDLAKVLFEVYDHGTQPNAFREAYEIIDRLNKRT